MENSLVPEFFGQGILIARSKTGGAQTCAWTDAGKITVMKTKILSRT